MNKDLLLVTIDSAYCDYLRKFDSKVPYNCAHKESRPFVGILFNINSIKYFAPLSSPKAKHLKMKNTLDVLKIKNGKLGIINFNNMIPVQENNYKLIDINYNFKYDRQYYNLLGEQLEWLNRCKNKIYKKSQFLYNSYINDKVTASLKKRCCNFILLEEKCLEYNHNLIKV